MAKKSKQLLKLIFQIGDFAYAKLRGHAIWPGIIDEINGNKAKITFFCPEKSWAWVNIGTMLAANEIETEKIKKKHKANKKLQRAIMELEFYLVNVRAEIAHIKTNQNPKIAEKKTKQNPKTKESVAKSDRILRSNNLTKTGYNLRGKK